MGVMTAPLRHSLLLSLTLAAAAFCRADDESGTFLPHVESLAALRALDPQNARSGEPVHVAHHTHPGDPGGGTFVWQPDLDYQWPPEPDNPEVYPGHRPGDNNGTVIRPDKIPPGRPGRWVRRVYLASGPRLVRPDWFGARPNQPDFDSAPAIQAAHDSLPIVTFGVGPAPTGRHIRPGAVRLGAGDYSIGGTLYQSSRTSLSGEGSDITSISAMVGKFDDPAPGAETWMVRWELPENVSLNNNFNCRLEDVSIRGNAPLSSSANRSVSGVRIQGAQGSWMRDVIFYRFAKRGTDCAVSILGSCWFADAREGPLIDLSGGPGYQFGNLSIEHVNPEGKHIDQETGLPVAALRIRNVILANFQQVQFETSPVNCSIVDGRHLTFNAVIVNRSGAPGTRTFHIQGDSYNNRFREHFYYLGGKADDFRIYNDSIIAKRDDATGEIYDKVILK